MKMRSLFVILAGVMLLLLLLAALPAAGERQAAAATASAAPFRLSGEFRISNMASSKECQGLVSPRAAYNAQQEEFLVVWSNCRPDIFRDIYARRLSSSGELKNQFVVASGFQGDGKSRARAALAYNETDKEFLVVYMVAKEIYQVNFDVWGRRVTWDGSWIGPEFLIFSWPNRSFIFPRVTWNSEHNEYLVVAHASDTQSGRYNDVAGRRVMADGSMPYPGRNISAQDQVIQPRDADVTYNPVTDEYLVVWKQLTAGDYNEGDIWGARLRGADSAMIAQLPVDVWPGPHGSPAVAVDRDGNYLVVWEHEPGGIYGRELDAGGGWLGNRFAIAASPDVKQDPSVAINRVTNERFVAWLQNRGDLSTVVDLWGIGWDPAATWPGTLWLPGRLAEEVGWDIPYVAAGTPGHLLLYGRKEGDDLHIFGRFYWPHAIYLPLALSE